MDITQSSRDYFAMPSPSASEKLSLAASSTVYTYHCLCTHLLLATSTPLHALPTRNNSCDQAHIMPLPPPPAAPAKGRRPSNEPALPPTDHYGLLLSTHLENKPEMVTSDSGFEKRYLQRCGRCNLVVGYQLDWQQFAGDRTGRKEDLVYLLPGGFVTTAEMIMGKTPPQGGIGMVTVAEIKT
ncbi:hypothetical protein BU23DRAFT_456038 [Bimuria novae-zelandiae CBS 107.79]|uniref:STEEP1 domain-containing protein n=1 Tax=Bimuria novae-zelandiae CBS 107.79 TaxID=1447943 RepID=A0A6A5VFV9_9PLEO|nr:hypothetical protein BU23DRAFT_456038 [Bimuria novae-zelandiae CBS 107.79]